MPKYNLLESFLKNNLSFFSGVPDSLLSQFSQELESSKNKISHVITPNEGTAVSIALGHFIASGNIGVVYLQNSGLGNIVNPVLSLSSKKVWKIPIFFVIGWRGSPNKIDEPQHKSQGAATVKLLKLLNIKFSIVNKNINYVEEIKKLKSFAIKNKNSVALLFPEKYINLEKFPKINSNKKKVTITRIKVLETILTNTKKSDLIIATTGKTARELYYLKDKNNIKLDDLYVVGGMGHASSIALGITETLKNKKIFLLDGDGALLMHMGILSLIKRNKNNLLVHVLLNNESHDSVGGQPSSISNVNLNYLSKAFHYDYYSEVKSLKKLENVLKIIKNSKSNNFINIKISKGSSPDLPRPKDKPYLNLKAFQEKIGIFNK